MNAIELLKSDHKRVSGLFEKFKANEEGDHAELFRQIKVELDTHAHIEETIFYPRMRADGDEELQKMVDESLEEHRQMKMFLNQISELSDGSDKMDPKLKVLIEDTEHHVMEEEGQMFPMVENQFDAGVLGEIGSQMEAEKKKFRPRSASA